VRGYLAILRAFVAELEEPEWRNPTLRGLLAPELAGDRFDAIVAAAEASERGCRAGGSASAAE